MAKGHLPIAYKAITAWYINTPTKTESENRNGKPTSPV